MTEEAPPHTVVDDHVQFTLLEENNRLSDGEVAVVSQSKDPVAPITENDDFEKEEVTYLSPLPECTTDSVIKNGAGGGVSKPLLRLTRSRSSAASLSSTTSASRRIRKYYQKQEELKANYEVDKQDVERFATSGVERAAEVAATIRRQDSVLAKITFAVNMALIFAKVCAAYFSGSYSVISSVVDSCVDVTSGVVIFCTSRAIQKRDPYQYPRGRTRLEPIAVIIVSIIMAVASIQMILESVQAIVEGRVNPRVEAVTLSIMGATIFVKFILMLLCYKFKSPSTLVLAQDHRNDCISNIVAILCAFLGSRYWIYLDPIGAILVSLYIAATWFLTGRSQINVLSGKAAKPEFINRIVKICTEHHPAILMLDTVLVYHWGTKFLVEVHVIMDKGLTLQETHDVSEPLQCKIESLNFVERCFVHVDYEYDHRPEDEHKVV